MTTFGEDQSPHEVTYATLAAQVRSMAPRALTANALDDAITLVEFMRDQALKMHDANITRAQELAEWERTIMLRERNLKIHERAVAAIMKPNAPRRISNLWK
jgi:hypothetical protein